jgi:hypothetical protein
MEKDQVLSVKIYFINPIDAISIVINTLTEIEYEAYLINESDKEKLLKIIKHDLRNVIFICIQTETAVDYWLEYINRIKNIQETNVQIGAFVFDRMDKGTRNKFLMEGVSVINFGDIGKNSLDIMKKILIFFEAMGKRPYITTKALAKSEIYFYVKNLETPITGTIIDISAYAFSCKIDQAYRPYFAPGTYIEEALLVLKGSRVKTSLSVVGFSRQNPNIYMMKFCTTRIDGNNLVCFVSITPEMSHKLHDYIRWCLKEKIALKLNKIDSKTLEEEIPEL